MLFLEWNECLIERAAMEEGQIEFWCLLVLWRLVFEMGGFKRFR